MTEYSSGSVAAENEQIERHAQVTFGFAARLEPLKGPLILMEAFAAASRKCSNLRATIVGSGSQKQAVMARARTLGVWDQCDFPSVYKTPEHKSAFMQSIDVFVLPSLTEGTPNSIIEAMAHGLPVIATCVGGVPDVVTNDTGVLVPPGDGDALAAAMTRLAKDPSLRSAMGHAAKERYEKLFSSVAVLPLMLSIYQRVAAGSGNYFGVASNSNGFPHPWARNHLMTSKTATQKQAAGSGAVG